MAEKIGIYIPLLKPHEDLTSPQIGIKFWSVGEEVRK